MSDRKQLSLMLPVCGGKSGEGIANVARGEEATAKRRFLYVHVLESLRHKGLVRPKATGSNQTPRDDEK